MPKKRSKSILGYFSICIALCLVTVTMFYLHTDDTNTAEPVFVGLGSYVQSLDGINHPSTGQPYEGPQSTIYKTSNLQGAIPTSDWVTSVLWRQYSGPLYAHPLSFMFTENGMEVSNPPKTTRLDAVGDSMFSMEHRSDFSIGSSTFKPLDARMDGASDWSFDIVMANGSDNVKATIAHGSPYAFFIYNSGNPKVDFTTPPSVFHQGSNVLGVTANGSHYGLFAPAGSSWSGIGSSSLICNLPSGKNYFSIALLPNSGDLDFYKHRAYSFLKKTKISYYYDEDESNVTTTFNAILDVKEGSIEETIFALYPHQWRGNTLIDVLPYEYSTIRGTMKTVSGTQFQTKYKYNGILPWMPDKAFEAPGAKEKIQKYITEYKTYGLGLETPFIEPGLDSTGGGYDTYWIGKNLSRLTNIAPIALQSGDKQAAEIFMTAARRTLEWWFNAAKYDPKGRKIPYNFFYYDANWGSLIGYPANYGSDTSLNDHHFQYGYWIYAAAQITLNHSDDPEWGVDSNWGGMVKELIMDYGNPNRSNTKYPFLRNFDPYAGHSWASGFVDFIKDYGYLRGSYSSLSAQDVVMSGNNQESSSEAINAWAAMILWGEATGDIKLRDAGIYMYVTEIQAANNYWFDLYGDVYDPEYYNRNMAVMIWGGKVLHQTWWTQNPVEGRAINMLPITGASFYLGTDPDYVKRAYDETLELWPAYIDAHQRQGWDTIADPLWWQDIMCQYLALYDPELALQKYVEPDSQGKPFPEFGSTRAHALHWIYNLDVMGLPDFGVTANTPLYSVFTKGSSRTYVVYNAGNDARHVKFSDGHTMMAAPKMMTTETGPAIEPPAIMPTMDQR